MKLPWNMQTYERRQSELPDLKFWKHKAPGAWKLWSFESRLPENENYVDTLSSYNQRSLASCHDPYHWRQTWYTLRETLNICPRTRGKSSQKTPSKACSHLGSASSSGCWNTTPRCSVFLSVSPRPFYLAVILNATQHNTKQQAYNTTVPSNPYPTFTI